MALRPFGVDEGEDRLGVDGHLGLLALEAVPGEDLLVVQDDPVVHAFHRAVADGVVVGGDPGVALCVVAHVDERLGGLGGNRNPVEERARAGTLLVHRERPAVASIGIADCVCAALGDSGEQGLSRERPIDSARALQAVSGDSTHMLIVGASPDDPARS